MNIGAVEVGVGGTKLVAAVGNAHNGSLELALRLVDDTKAAGFDLIRFDLCHPDGLAELRGESFKGQRERVLDPAGPLPPNEEGFSEHRAVWVDTYARAPEPWGSQDVPMETFYRMTRTPHTWLRQLVKRCEALGIQWWATATDKYSLATLESFQCPAYKLGATEISPRADEIRARILDTGKPLVQSVPDGFEAPAGTEPLYRPDPAAVDLRKLSGTLGLSYNGTDARVLRQAEASGAAMIEANVALDDVAPVYGQGRSLRLSEAKRSR